MRNVKCRNCGNYKNEWCEPKCDSPCPDIERDCEFFKEVRNIDWLQTLSIDEAADLLSNHSYSCHACPIWKIGFCDRMNIKIYYS